MSIQALQQTGVATLVLRQGRKVMMRILHECGAYIMVAGLFAIMAGGMSIHRGPHGTFIQVNAVHGIGGGLLLVGTIVSFIAAFAGRQSNAEAEND